jgi:DUF1009 family protein
MRQRLGVIAGSGEFPFHVCQEARQMGNTCVVAGIKGEAENILEEKAENFAWFGVHEIGNIIAFFKKNQVSEAVFAGKIDHRNIYENEGLRKTLPALLGTGRDWTPTALIQTAITIFSAQGIAIKDPTPFFASALCEKGILTETTPSPKLEEDILFGWDIARRLADLDIGQTVIIKGKAIVAVEGMEGTDEAIKRAGVLAGKGIIVVKVSRSSQDPRIDLPVVGLETVKSLVQAGGLALGFEAQKVPFLQKDEAISLANVHGISLIAK